MTKQLQPIDRIHLAEDEYLQVFYGYDDHIISQATAQSAEAGAPPVFSEADQPAFYDWQAIDAGQQALYTAVDPGTQELFSAVTLGRDSFPRESYTDLSQHELRPLDESAHMSDRLQVGVYGGRYRIVSRLVVKALSHYTEMRAHNRQTPPDERMTGVFTEVAVSDPWLIGALTNLVKTPGVAAEGFDISARSTGYPQRFCLELPLTQIQTIIPEHPSSPW